MRQVLQDHQARTIVQAEQGRCHGGTDPPGDHQRDHLALVSQRGARPPRTCFNTAGPPGSSTRHTRERGLLRSGVTRPGTPSSSRRLSDLGIRSSRACRR